MLFTTTIIKSILFGLVISFLVILIIMVYFYNINERKPIKLHSDGSTVQARNENEIDSNSDIQSDLKNGNKTSTVLNNEEDTEAEDKVKERSNTFNKTEIKKNVFDNNDTIEDVQSKKCSFDINTKENDQSGTNLNENDQPGNNSKENKKQESNSNEKNSTQDIYSDSNESQSISNESYQPKSRSKENSQTVCRSNVTFQSKTNAKRNDLTRVILSDSNSSECKLKENIDLEGTSTEKEQTENISNINDLLTLNVNKTVNYKAEKDGATQIKDRLKNLPNNKNDDNILDSKDAPKCSETTAYLSKNETSSCNNSRENGNLFHVNVSIFNTIYSSERAIPINENNNQKEVKNIENRLQNTPNHDETSKNSLYRQFDCSCSQVVDENDIEETLNKKEELVMRDSEDCATDVKNFSCLIIKSESNSENISTKPKIPESSCLDRKLLKRKNNQGEKKEEVENEASISVEKLYKLKETQKNATKEDNLSGMTDPKKSSPLNILIEKNQSKEERFKSIEMQAEKNKILETEETIAENVFEATENIEFNNCYCMTTETIHIDKNDKNNKKPIENENKCTDFGSNLNKDDNCQALKLIGIDENLKLAYLFDIALLSITKKHSFSINYFLFNQKIFHILTKNFESSIQENPIDVNEVICAFKNFLKVLSAIYDYNKYNALDFIDTKITDKKLNIVKNYNFIKNKVIRNKFEKLYKRLNHKEITETLHTKYSWFDENFLLMLTRHFKLSYLFYTSAQEFGNFMLCIKNNDFVLFKLIYSFYNVLINKKNEKVKLAGNVNSVIKLFFNGAYNVPSRVDLIYYVETQLLFKIMKKDDIAMAFKSKFLELLNHKTEL